METKETTVYLVRHGESTGNIKKQFVGSTDLDLSPAGERQVASLTAAFEGVRLDRIISSHYIRAVRTAKALRGERDMDIEIDDGFREIDCGLWEEMTFDEVNEAYPGQLIMWQKYTHMLRMPKGDTVEEVRARAFDAFLRVIRESEGKSVAIATHMMTVHTIMISLLGIPVHRMHDLPDSLNTGITELRVRTEGNKVFTRLIRYSDVSHLPSELCLALVGGEAILPDCKVDELKEREFCVGC